MEKESKPILDWHIETVERGDTWQRLAIQHGISIEALKLRNSITNKNDALHLGQQLWVPGK